MRVRRWSAVARPGPSPISVGRSMAGAFGYGARSLPLGSGRAPWHFYLLMVALVMYLGWRLIQGIGIVIGWL